MRTTTAIVSAVSKHGDMMRMAIASPGNDFRLGAIYLTVILPLF